MRIPLFGTGVSSGQKQVTVRKTVGMYWERRGETEKSPMVAVPFPGATDIGVTGTSGDVRAVARMEDSASVQHLLAVIGTKAYRIVPTSGAKTELGTVSGGGNAHIIPGEGGQAVFIAGGALHFWDGATWTDVAPTIDEPWLASGAGAWMDGYWIVAEASSKRFHVSTDGISWADIASAEASPDAITGILSTRNELFIFGSMTTEVWGSTGSSDFPFERINGATSGVGAAVPVLVAGVPYFIARSGGGAPYVARMNGYTPERVSTDDIDRLLATSTGIFRAFGFVWNGHPMYQLSRSAWTLLYDADTGMWSTVTDGAPHLMTIGAEISGGAYGGGSGPNIYKLDATAHNLPKRQIITDHVVSPDGERFTVDSLRLDMATNIGSSEKSVSLKVSRDGGLSWGSQQTVGLGTSTGPQKKVEFRRLGRSRSFAFDLSFPTDVPLTVHSASLNASD